MQHSLAACAAGDPAWDPLPPHTVPRGDHLVPQKQGGGWVGGRGGVSCRSSSSVGAVPKKVDGTVGNWGHSCLQLTQKLWLNRVAGKS